MQKQIANDKPCSCCGSTSVRMCWQEFKDKSHHLRRECAGCGKYLGYLPRCQAGAVTGRSAPEDPARPTAPIETCGSCGKVEARLQWQPTKKGKCLLAVCSRCGRTIRSAPRHYARIFPAAVLSASKDPVLAPVRTFSILTSKEAIEAKVAFLGHLVSGGFYPEAPGARPLDSGEQSFVDDPESNVDLFIQQHAELEKIRSELVMHARSLADHLDRVGRKAK